jgi:hypothetical protein
MKHKSTNFTMTNPIKSAAEYQEQLPQGEAVVMLLSKRESWYSIPPSPLLLPESANPLVPTMTPATLNIDGGEGDKREHVMMAELSRECCSSSSLYPLKFKKLLCANRGEIAIRVFRAAVELGLRTVAIFSHEDRLAQHRYKADEAYEIVGNYTPVGAYLAMDAVIAIAKRADVDLIHPGYGFLSENAVFAKKVRDAGIAYVGPPADIISKMGDKTVARQIAIECGVPVVPGTDAVKNLDQAEEEEVCELSEKAQN